MKIGAIFPTTEIGNDPVVIRDWVQTAEQLGYAHVLIYDHVLGSVHADRDPKLLGPYTESDAFHEPFVLFSYLAALTKTIEFMTGILILPQRQTALVAKQAAELDLLSGGRFRLGVGTGWNWVEYEALGIPYEDRGSLLSEQVELLRRLWREPVVEFHGRHHEVDRAGLLPRPSREIPIWFGGFTPVAMRRAVRMGDGFIFGVVPSQSRGLLSTLQEFLRTEKRDVRGFGAEATIEFGTGPERWNKELEIWRELGGTQVSLRAMDTGSELLGIRPVGYDGPPAYIDALETFMQAVRSG